MIMLYKCEIYLYGKIISHVGYLPKSGVNH